MNRQAIRHETAHRLRVAVPADADLDALRGVLEHLPGVRSVRTNGRLRCVVVGHDGARVTRDAVLECIAAPAPATRPARARRPRPRRRADAAWAPAALAASVPLLPAHWRPGGALTVVVARVLTQGDRLREDAPAVLLDATSLAALALSGQSLVVSASVLLRLLAERLSARFVRQADGLLNRLLPTEAARYQALRGPGDAAADWWPLRELRAGDRVRLFPGDVVPLDGCVVDGTAALSASAHHAAPREVRPGDHLAAGERLQEGTLELRAEADAASSRLERMRAQLRHAMHSRDPAGRLAQAQERLLSLPLTAAALVFGLTGDTARAAAMLQSDPQQGLDLALPLAREAALYVLARQGLLTGGLEAIERLASARTLVLQDTGVLASGRWRIEAIDCEPGGEPERVRGWLARLALSADQAPEVLQRASFPDDLVRRWIRHGALLHTDGHELHLASRERLRRVWGDLPAPDPLPPTEAALRRELLAVAAGRVVARVQLVSPLRDGAARKLAELSALGFERIALFAEADGGGAQAPPPLAAALQPRLEAVPDEPGMRSDWLADAVSDGTPLVMAHTVLRDLVPPGSLSLTTMDADAGAHGLLLGDALESLVSARRVAKLVHRRLRVQQDGAVAANATLMTAAALRWMPPLGTALLHHGFALLLLLDSLRVESMVVRSEPP